MDPKQKSTEKKKKNATKINKNKTDEVELLTERYAHYDIYVRHPYFVPGVKNVYHIRESLAEYLKQRMILAPDVFYQRVFMFAKKTGKERGTKDEPMDKEVAEEAGESEEESEYNALSTDSEMFSDYEEEELEYSLQQRFVKRPAKIKVLKQSKTSKQAALIHEKLIKLINETDNSNITSNKITGLFMSIGDDYAIFMFESSEDVIGKLLYNLNTIRHEIWSECRVFHMEHHVSHTFFDGLQSVEVPSINTHEKLLPNMCEDRDFMARQHFDLKSRLNKVCEILSPKFSTLPENIIAEFSEMPSIDNMKIYLPEVQRIELILKCELFYHSFKQFIRIYGIIPHQKDDDAYAWPLPTDYTPSGIFRRNEFDVNLTFGDYLQQDTAVEQRGSSDSQTSEY